MSEPQQPDMHHPEVSGTAVKRAAQAADGNWHRVHPISPVVQGWLVLVAAVVVVVQNMEGSFDVLREVFIGETEVDLGALLIPLLIIVGGFIVIVVGFWVSWRFYRFRITPQMVQVHSGFIFRKQRHVRLDRVQAVDIRRRLLARIFGLAELTFEVADGGETAMNLAFVRQDDAVALRYEIMRRASTAQDDTTVQDDTTDTADTTDDAATDLEATTPADSASPTSPISPTSPASPISMPGHTPEQVMLTVPTGRLIGSTLLNDVVPWVVGVFAVYAGSILVLNHVLEGDSDSDFSLTWALVPALIPMVFALWSSFSRNYHFTVASSQDGLRLRYGLLDTASQTVPPGRVQSVGIRQGLIWRAFGWYKVQINMAGYGLDTDSKTTVLPVGTFEDVLRVLTVVAPNPGTSHAQELMRAGMTGKNDDGGFITTPSRLRFLDPLTWRRNGFGLTPTLVLFRTGRLARKLTLMSHERIQSLELSQGPLTRRLGVATIHVHTPDGPVHTGVHHIDVTVAQQLFLHESAIAAVSRRMSDRNQWMRSEELHRFNTQTDQAHHRLAPQQEQQEEQEQQEASR